MHVDRMVALVRGARSRVAIRDWIAHEEVVLTVRSVLELGRREHVNVRSFDLAESAALRRGDRVRSYEASLSSLARSRGCREHREHEHDPRSASYGQSCRT